MDIEIKGFLISDNKNLIQIHMVCSLLKTTYWAGSRDTDTIQKSIDNSLCFGIYKDGNQVGYARCVTDYATVFWLCDVVIDNDYRGQGLGKLLIEFITNHDDLKSLSGILATRDAQGLYEQFGFICVQNGLYMRKPPNI